METHRLNNGNILLTVDLDELEIIKSALEKYVAGLGIVLADILSAVEMTDILEEVDEDGR